MRYVCSICGYVYDEAKQGKPFAALPETWTCPLCGAAKSAFAPEAAAKSAAPAPTVAPAPRPPASWRYAKTLARRALHPLLQPRPRLRKAVQGGRSRPLPRDR